MDVSRIRLRRSTSNILSVLVALTAGSGMLNAALTATPSTVSLTCSTVTGPGPSATIAVKSTTALTGSNTIAVTVGSLSGGVVVTAPVSQTLNATNSGTSGTGITYTVSLAAACAGVSTGSTTFRFQAGGVPDATITVNTTLNASTSGLSVSPSPVTISCVKVGSTYTPGTAQTVSVTTAASGGMPFTVDTTVAPPAAWLVINPTTGGTATSSPTTFTVAAASGCGAFALGTSNTTTIHLVNAPAPDKLITVTLQIVAASPLTATPNPATLTYVKGSGTAGKVDINITSATNPAPFFAVDTASLPIWLTVDSTTGTVPKSLRFSSTNVADTLAPGTYSTSVRLKVSGSGDLAVPISLLITNKAPRLSVAEGTTRNLTWTIGQALPTPMITAVSTDTPISYTVSTGGTLAPVVAAAQQSGLAYSFGTPISVSFNPLIFAAAQPGSLLTGTVTLTWGSPASTIVVTFNVTVLSPGATVTGLTPASLPTAPSGTVFTVVLTGTGFIPSTDSTQKTKVGVVISGALVADTNISTNIVNPSNITLTITVPAVADANLPFAPTGTGGSVNIGVCNPVGGTCTIPSGTATLSIGSNPIIQAVTSSSSLVQVTPPALPTISTYDMVSIFGANFCSSSNTGCSTNQVLFGQPDPVTQSYPTSLSPDASGATQRQLSVTFQTQGGSPTVLGSAPLLFATNSQINLLVPSGVAAQIGNSVDVVVSFGYGTGATMKSSAPFSVNVAATNPGIFTIGADGQGDGAALDSTYSLITAANPGGMRSTAADSDILQLYMTGLGVPDSSGDNSTAGTSGAWSGDCASTATYLSSFNSVTGNSLTSLDGTLMLTSPLNTNRIIPCIASGGADVPSVTIGGVAGTVAYAGWVPSAVAGLYQLNVKLPGSASGPFTNSAGQAVSSITQPAQLPVVVTANGKSSQGGVNLWVTPRLKVLPPSGGGLTGTVGILWSSSNNVVVASEGTSTYRYAVTSGLLPSGLSLGATTGAITGTPAANTAGSYAVTVTATDSAAFPVKGTTTFTLTIAGGLFMTSSGTAPYHTTFGTASGGVTTVTATSGLYPYAFAITSPSSIPTGMAVGASSGVLSTSAATPAGTYTVTIGATDSSSTPLTGSITFDVVEALLVARSTPVAGTAGSASTITTVSATGNTGVVTYALDTATAALGWVTIDANTGVVAVTTGSIAGTRSITVTATDGTAPSNASAAGVGSVTFSMVIN